METESNQTDLQQLISRAKSAKESGDLELAAAILSEANLIEIENWDVYNELYDVAKALIDTNSAAALIVINFILAKYADFEGIGLEYLDYPLFNRGVDLINSGDLKRGEELIRAGIKFYPESEFFKYMLGYLLLRQERYDEGIYFIEQAIELGYYQDENDFFENIEAIAWAKFKLGHIEEALQDLLYHFDRLLDARILDIYLRFIRLLDDKAAIDAFGKMQKKIEYWELEEYPQYRIENQDALMHDFYLERGKRYQRMGKKEAAAFYFSLASDYCKVKENIEAILGLGNALIDIDSPDEALELAEQAANVAPKDLRHHALRAKALVSKKDFQSGLQAAENGLALAEEQPETVIRENGQDYLVNPILDEIEAAQEGRDARAELLLSKVDALTGLVRFEDALDTLRKAQGEYPKEIIFYRYAAALLFKTGKPRDAQSQFLLARKAGVKLDKPSRELQKKIKDALVNQE